MEQLSLFDFPKYKIQKKIRLIELFSGIGSQAKALENLDKKGRLPRGFEHYKVVEVDKYAIKSYNAIHNTDFKISDITQIHASDLQIVERELSKEKKMIDKLNDIKVIGNLFEDNGYKSAAGRIYDTEFIAPTLGASLFSQIVYISEEQKEESIKSKRVQDNDNTSPDITVGGVDGISIIESAYRIRKLTPKECWRLMGFDDDAFERAQSVNSNAQLYKQAGNSIVVDVLEAIFEELL